MKCQECERTEDEGIELVTVPCGEVLCEDDAAPHAMDCGRCKDEMAFSHSDILYKRSREG